jgi:hypothetical protein
VQKLHLHSGPTYRARTHNALMDAGSAALCYTDSIRTALILIIAAVLAGCVTARPLTLPNGAHGEVIRCNGMARSMADCYEKAGEACPKGYDIVDENGEAHPLVMANSNAIVGGSVVHRSLMVQCHS